jgi:hypothetical protein
MPSLFANQPENGKFDIIWPFSHALLKGRMWLARTAQFRYRYLTGIFHIKRDKRTEL